MLGLMGALVLVVGLAGVGFSVLNQRTVNETGNVQSADVSPTPTPVPTPSVVAYDGVEGKTALELLRVKDPAAVTQGEGANAFVTKINGYEASASKKEFWAFYVNGKQAAVGAGSYITKSGDKIEWKIETY